MRSACWNDMGDHRKAEKLLFALYGLMMLWLLLLRRIGGGAGEVQVNLQPMDTLRRYIWVLRHSGSVYQRRYAVANLVGNVSLFVPLGIFLPRLFRKMEHFWRFFLCVVLTVAAVELLQMLTGLGACDVDDLLLNTIGAVMGWLGWKILKKKE